MIKKSVFGVLDNQDILAYTLENDKIQVTILEFGATIQSFIVKEDHRDIVLGYDTIEEYKNERGTYLGATIGRVCNRIEKGKFLLNDKEYTLPINNTPNTLHGGTDGFDKKIFQAKIVDEQLKLTYLSRDGEEGFPGNLTLTITFFVEDTSLHIEYEATSDQDTYVNFTNHSYFNLDGIGAIDQHTLYVNAEYCGKVDESGLSTGELLELYQTPLDFRRETRIQSCVNQIAFDQVRLAKGIDHHYVVLGEGYRLFSTLSNDDYYLKVYSDLPGMHVYSGNYIIELLGKKGSLYQNRAGICFETQYFPNNINNTQLPKSILKSGEVFKHQTVFTLKRKGK